MSDTALLNNVIWHTLTGQHAAHAQGAGQARRYAQGFSPMLGFSDPAQPAWSDLEPYCTAGEHLYCGGWSGSAPQGWRIEAESTMFQMVWHGGQPPAAEPAFTFVRLQPEHAAQALELATLTRPGPFGIRTPELGEYVGCFEGDRLIAMAGERLHAGRFHEVSGVCTHPDHQGRGLARQLMNHLIRRQLQRGEIPFLHVMRDNVGAHGLYTRMGFRDNRESVVRVVVPG